MRLNIYNFLQILGYDVVGFTEDGVYTVCYNAERLRRLYADIDAGDTICDFDIHGNFVVTAEAFFNGVGGLVVEFTEVETGDCLDVYEFGNMPGRDLY